MNTEITPASELRPGVTPALGKTRSLGCIIGLVILGTMAAAVIGLGATALHALRLGPAARDLREIAQEHFEANGRWEQKIEVRLGTLWCTLLRSIATAAADDPDATAALSAARAVECGVYEVNALSSPAERARMLRDMNAAMTARGWTRVVAVVDGDATVAVFVPDQMPAVGEVKIGVFVNDGQDLVIAVARAKLQPLLELARRHADLKSLERFER